MSKFKVGDCVSVLPSPYDRDMNTFYRVGDVGKLTEAAYDDNNNKRCLVEFNAHSLRPGVWSISEENLIIHPSERNEYSE